MLGGLDLIYKHFHGYIFLVLIGIHVTKFKQWLGLIEWDNLEMLVVKRLVLQFDKDDLDDKAKEQCTIDDDIIAIQNTKRGLMATLLKEESLRSNGRDTRKRSGLTKTDYKRCLT